MVTRYLEELIHKGEATYKTAVLGTGAVSVIRLPPNRFAVITDFTYFYWNPNQYLVDNGINLEDIRATSVHQITFRSTKSTNRFMVKNPERIDQTGAMGPPQDVVQINGYAQFDTYLMHENNIFVEILHQPGDNNNAIASILIPRTSNNVTPPLGYGVEGNGFPVVAAFGQSGGALDIVAELPLTSEFTPDFIVGPNEGQKAVNNKQFLVADDTVFEPPFSGGFPGDGTEQRVLPIMNIGYVEIRRKSDTQVQSTS